MYHKDQEGGRWGDGARQPLQWLRWKAKLQSLLLDIHHTIPSPAVRKERNRWILAREACLLVLIGPNSEFVFWRGRNTLAVHLDPLQGFLVRPGIQHVELQEGNKQRLTQVHPRDDSTSTGCLVRSHHPSHQALQQEFTGFAQAVPGFLARLP